MGCTSLQESSDPDPVLPVEAVKFRLNPNDNAGSDSAAANLSSGVVIPGYPGASYELSFVGDGGSVPDLRLYRVFPMGNQVGISTDKLVEGSLTAEGRWVYRFKFTQPISGNWVTVLERNEERYMGFVSQLSLITRGAGSLSFSINLWVTGAYVAPEGEESVEVLAQGILAGLRKFYTPAGVTVDTIYIRNAADHPLLGKFFPASIPVLAEGINDRYDSLGYGLSGLGANALDLVLVYGFTSAEMLGESPLLGLSLDAGPSGSVIISTHRKPIDQEDYVPLSLSDIVGTAEHEIGHFFGLRHTSSTLRDITVGGDASAYEDGFIDTPFCNGVLNASVSNASNPNFSLTFASALIVALSCPDQNNLMFPYSSGTEADPLTPQQLALLRANVPLF